MSRALFKIPIHHSGIFCVMLAALCWGLSGGIAGLLITDGWDPFVVSFYRGAIGLLFVIAWLALQPNGSGLGSRRLWFWSVIAGLGLAGNFAFYFVSIAEGSIAVAITLMYCAPVFVYLVSFALKLERPTPLKFLAIALVITGVLLLTGISDVETNDVAGIAIGSGLLSGMSYALFIFGFKYASPHGSPQAILAIAFTVLVGVLFLPGDGSQMATVLHSQSWPLFAILGLVGAGLSFFFYIVGLKKTAPTVAAVVAMVEPVTASLFGVVVLGQTLRGMQVVGMALILLTVTGLSIRSGHAAVDQAGTRRSG